MRACERCLTPYKTRVEYCGLDGAPVVEHDTDPLVGTTFDRYRVTERLGGGGMAVVYRARHEVIDREVAIKVLFGELASDREFAERFRREAQTASRIKHPNIVEIFDFGETREGMSFLVMELLRGETLNDAIQWTGAFAPRRAASVLKQIAAGLKAAHEMGFIHRDLKPGNVMVVRGGPGQPIELAKILDFGLVLVESDDGQRLTKTGQTLGTPHYMAPEQFAGGEATVLSDLYSLGAVLHEMLAGQAPFRGSLGEVVVQQQSKPPPPLPKSGGLEKLAAKLLEKDARKRLRSADEVIAFIDGLRLGDVRPEDVPPKPETLDLDLHQVIEVSGGSGLSGDQRTEALDEPPRPPPAKAELIRPAPAPAKAAPDDGGPDDDEPDDDNDERATREGLDVVDPPPEGAAAEGEPPPPPPVSAPETEYIQRGSPVPAAVHGAGRVLVMAALLGALALTVALFVVARLGPATGEPAEAALASAEAPDEDPSAEVTSALARRGLRLTDAADLPALAPAVKRWQATLDGGTRDEVRQAAAALVLEIERAKLDRALLRRKLLRLDSLTRTLPPAEAAKLGEQAKALWQEADHDLSEAECSRLARRVYALEEQAHRLAPAEKP